MRWLSWLRGLFKPKLDEPAPHGKIRIDITFTDEEEAAISMQFREFYREFSSVCLPPKPGQSLYVSPEMDLALKALGLVKHVYQQLDIADRLPADEFPLRLDKIIQTQAKVCAIHFLPFYIHLWAVLNQEKGDMETANRLYGLFLSEQAKFKPSKVDQWIIGYITIEGRYHIEEAIENARKMLAI